MSRPVPESYPPLFRQDDPDFIAAADEEGIKREPEISPDQLPVIDLQRLDLDNLSEACREWGVFRLVNHGIPETLLDKLHQHTAQMFDLGFEAKQSLFSPDGIGMPLTYFWGTPALTPSGVPLQRLDFNWVEGFYVPLGENTLPRADQSHEYTLLHSFRLLLEEYGDHQSRLARTIFEAMAKNLNLGVERTELYLSASTGYLRVYRYPRCAVNKRAWGIDVHTDSSILTILNQDDVGGLQLYKDGTWIDAKPIPDTLIVHLGDMMQAISDDEYKSVQHRVKVNRHKDRISVGYFMFPGEDCVIQSSTYRPFSYADFRAQVQHDLKTTGFKVGLERFKLDKDTF